MALLSNFTAPSMTLSSWGTDLQDLLCVRNTFLQFRLWSTSAYRRLSTAPPALPNLMRCPTPSFETSDDCAAKKESAHPAPTTSYASAPTTSYASGDSDIEGSIDGLAKDYGMQARTLHTLQMEDGSKTSEGGPRTKEDEVTSHEDRSQASLSAPTSASQANDKGKPKRKSKAKTKGNPAHEGSEPTTLYISYLPNNLTHDQLIQTLVNMECTGYDFVYVPNDLHRLCGLGYAFVNFVSHAHAQNAREKLHGFSDWRQVNPNSMSKKICEVGWGAAGDQGLEYLIEKYRNSPVMHEDVPKKAKPALYRDGAPIEFPAPTKVVKAPRLTSKAWKSDKQGNSSAD